MPMSSNTPATPALERDPAPLAELTARLTTAGCFKPAWKPYALRAALVAAAIAAGYAGLMLDPAWPLRIALIALTAFASVQAAFIGHEIGDGALGTTYRTSARLNQILLSFATGTSASYFDHVHALHHVSVARGRHPGKTGDWLTNPYEIRWIKRAAAVDGTLFMAVTTALRALTFKLESLRFLRTNPALTRADRVFLAAHYLAALALPMAVIGAAPALVNYALITLLAGPYVGLILIINHEGMSTADDHARLPRAERVLATTRNLPGGALYDILFGGVNNHIEHHLFPEIAAPNLPKARRVAEAFFRETGQPYTVTRPLAALGASLRHFRAMPPHRLAAEALS